MTIPLKNLIGETDHLYPDITFRLFLESICKDETNLFKSFYTFVSDAKIEN